MSTLKLTGAQIRFNVVFPSKDSDPITIVGTYSFNDEDTGAPGAERINAQLTYADVKSFVDAITADAKTKVSEMGKGSHVVKEG